MTGRHDGVVHVRNQPYSNLLIEYFEDFLARAAFEQLTVHLKTFDSFTATLSWPQVQRAVFRRVVFPRLRELLDDVFDL